MTDAKSKEERACCAHLHVSYATSEADGITTGWWACEDCKQIFLPANLLKEITSGWETEKSEGAVTVHHRMVGGVLCRWWGDGQPPEGVALIDRAVCL